MRLVFIALALLLTLPVTRSAQAEYRVFRLVIKDVETKAQREVLSTLDPFQYVGYFPLKPGEGIDYVDTWRCFEDNGHFANYCPSPKTRSTASATPPTSK